MMNELVSKLKAYIDGNLTDAEFSTWFYTFSRTIEADLSGKNLAFVYEIQAILAESSSGGWSHAGLLGELEVAIQTQASQTNSAGSVGVAILR